VTTSRWPIPPRIEAAARAMNKSERVYHLKAHGWTRISSGGPQSWRAPQDADHAAYTLAAAIRRQLDREAHP
jgi:hypothetical protein